MQKAGFVYVMTTLANSVLYIGVTSNLSQRVWQHRTKYYPNCFTAKYNCVKLVYYYRFDSIGDAIAGEKRLKDRHRAFKIDLIKKRNPNWQDLWEEINE
ncbi:GIY-YIG nuclease family protein [Taibaiella soli]|uniref:GIY-YIG nuclease family protein n=1 Tax=Taibaiella soli TaxID=1649169 RepID=A0A2W2A758_9BACT|nr:GIY-YIG nuclease family protein [Taibaiella soli]PZF71145.1 GIY-YIG nuclease family protein [Taibaiella soli]